MTEAPKYKGVSVADMTPEQVTAAVIEMLTAITPEELKLAQAEIDRIKAERPVESGAKGAAHAA